MPCEDDDEEEEIRRRPSVMDHPLHPHQLSSYYSKTQTKIKCGICRDPVPSGDFLGCSDCRFFLHESCAQPIQHYLHPEHTLTFAPFLDEKKHECPICESLIGSDSYCYTCQMCDFFIHRTCASATLSDLEKGVGMTVQYSFHEHELKLCNANDLKKYNKRCTGCSRIIRWEVPAYKCVSQECSFQLHRSCAQLPSNLVHPSHSLHPLTLCFKPPNEDMVCRGCYMGIRGLFAFSCGEGECNFYLHVVSAQVPTLQHPFHEHHLFYFPVLAYSGSVKPKHFQCSACRKSCKLDLFRCAQCNFNLHYDCSQLPPTTKSEHHWEPLVLRESYVEDDSGEYYCDICEKRRDPNKWVYFCDTGNCKCKLVAHVECALSPARMDVIEEDNLIRLKEDIQGREEEIKLGQQQVKAKEVSLRPLMEELVSMRAKLESQRAELKEMKTERAKYINMEVMEEDKSVRGEEDIDAELETLRAILKKLETEQAKWLIDFLKTKCNLESALFSQ